MLNGLPPTQHQLLIPSPRTLKVQALAPQQATDLIPDPNLPVAAERDGPAAARALHAQAASGSPTVERQGSVGTQKCEDIGGVRPLHSNALVLARPRMQGGPTKVKSSFLSVASPVPKASAQLHAASSHLCHETDRLRPYDPGQRMPRRPSPPGGAWECEPHTHRCCSVQSGCLPACIDACTRGHAAARGTARLSGICTRS